MPPGSSTRRSASSWVGQLMDLDAKGDEGGAITALRHAYLTLQRELSIREQILKGAGGVRSPGRTAIFHQTMSLRMLVATIGVGTQEFLVRNGVPRAEAARIVPTDSGARHYKAGFLRHDFKRQFMDTLLLAREAAILVDGEHFYLPSSAAEQVLNAPAGPARPFSSLKLASPGVVVWFGQGLRTGEDFYFGKHRAVDVTEKAPDREAALINSRLSVDQHLMGIAFDIKPDGTPTPGTFGYVMPAGFEDFRPTQEWVHTSSLVMRMDRPSGLQAGAMNLLSTITTHEWKLPGEPPRGLDPPGRPSDGVVRAAFEMAQGDKLGDAIGLRMPTGDLDIPEPQQAHSVPLARPLPEGYFPWSSGRGI